MGLDRKSLYSYINIIAVVLLFLSSCAYPKYLTEGQDLRISHYGSYVSVYLNNQHSINGELLSVDSLSLIVLTPKKIKEKEHSIIIPLEKLKKIKVQYAKSAEISPFLITIIPSLFLYTLSPVFILTNITISTIGLIIPSSFYTFYLKKADYIKLKPFARFPQGIPSGIPIDSIKYPKPVMPKRMDHMIDSRYSHINKY